MPASGRCRATPPSLRTSPARSPASPTLRSTAPPIPTAASASTADADPRRPRSHRALHAHGAHLFLDRRLRARAARSPSEFGLRVSVGAWIDKNAQRNERELRAVIDLARKHRNIDSIVVGNETIYRGDQTVDELIRKIQRVKRETSVPVTTGEIWHAWIEHPELASAVDFIAAHVLPYWEGISGDRRGRSGHPHLQPAAAGLSRQAHRDRRVRLAERRLQPARRQSRPARAGRGAARFRRPRRRARHRLQHHRSLRSAVEDLRRRRRPLLGHVRHLARSRSSPGPARSPIPTTGSSPRSPC